MVLGDWSGLCNGRLRRLALRGEILVRDDGPYDWYFIVLLYGLGLLAIWVVVMVTFGFDKIVDTLLERL